MIYDVYCTTNILHFFGGGQLHKSKIPEARFMWVVCGCFHISLQYMATYIIYPIYLSVNKPFEQPTSKISCSFFHNPRGPSGCTKICCGCGKQKTPILGYPWQPAVWLAGCFFRILRLGVWSKAGPKLDLHTSVSLDHFWEGLRQKLKPLQGADCCHDVNFCVSMTFCWPLTAFNSLPKV